MQAALAQLAVLEVAEGLAVTAPVVAEAVVEAPVAIAVATREEAAAAEVAITQVATKEVVVHITVEHKGTTSTYVYLLESAMACTYCYSHKHD